MTDAFGVSKNLTPKQKHAAKVAAGTAAGAGAAAVVGVRGHRYVRMAQAGNALRNLEKPGRAAALAEHMSRGGKMARQSTERQIKWMEEGGKSWSGRNFSGDLARAYTQSHPDYRYVKHTARRWTRGFKDAKRIKDQNPDAPVKTSTKILRPVKARAQYDAKIIDVMGRNSPVVEHPIYRGHVAPRPGQHHISSDNPTSWSAEPRVASAFTEIKRTPLEHLGLGRHHETSVHRIPGGKVRAWDLGGTTRPGWGGVELVVPRGELKRARVNKDLAGTVRWTTKAGKTMALKAKEAPVKAQVKAMNVGERIASTAPKKATKTRKALRRITGEAMKQVGYRPDYLAMAAAKIPSLPVPVQLAA